MTRWTSGWTPASAITRRDRLGLVAAAALVFSPVAALAEAPADAVEAVDLAVHHTPASLPDSLAMRTAAVGRDRRDRNDKAVAADSESAVVAQGTEVPPVQRGAATGSYDRIPTSLRDAEERVIFRFNLGYRVDQAGANGDVGLNGAAPGQVNAPDGQSFEEGRQYFVGDLAVGSRGVLTPSLNTYLLANYQFDTDGASQFAALNNVYDARDGGAVLVKAGYAEIDGLGEVSPALDGLFVRAGRQFHQGAAVFITHFDGLQASYDINGVEVGGFFGRRVSLFLNNADDFERPDFFGRRQTLRNDPGLLGGANVTLRGQQLLGVPADLDIEYLFFDGGSDLEINNVSLARQYLEAASRIKLAGNTRVYVRARLSDNGDRCDGQILLMDPTNRESNDAVCQGAVDEGGLGLGRVSVQVRKPFGKKLLAVAEAEHIFDGEAGYDFISPSAIDIVNVGNQIGLGFVPYADTTRLGARVSYAIDRELEVYGFARAQLAADSTSGFNETYQELGAAAAANLGRAIDLLAQYKVRLRQLDDDANGEDALFFDTSGSGPTMFQELSGEARYSFGYRKAGQASMGSYRKATVGLGGYLRVLSLETPFVETTNDARAGARFTGNYWISKMLRVHAAGEIAQPSSTFAPEIGTIVSVRGLLEARF